MGSTAVPGLCGPPREIGAAGLLARASRGGGNGTLAGYRRYDPVQVGQFRRQPSAVNKEHRGNSSVEIEIVLSSTLPMRIPKSVATSRHESPRASTSGIL